jgi:hypothetical protein
VKEPEELAYIFISIAVGLGCGANQLAVVSIAIPLILAVMSLRLFFQKTSRLPNLYLNIETPTNGDRAPLQGLVDSLSPHVANLDLRRFDDEKGRLAATFFMECQDLASVEKIREALRKRHPDSRFSFVEQSGLPGN